MKNYKEEVEKISQSFNFQENRHIEPCSFSSTSDLSFSHAFCPNHVEINPTSVKILIKKQ